MPELPCHLVSPQLDGETQRPLGRIVHKADFERVLAIRSSIRSAHFALHYLASTPATRSRPPVEARSTELSTGPAPHCPQAVDDSPKGLWFGCVVPKRHARRAVTRNLLKRQVRGAFQRHGQALPAGLWLVRLRAPFASSEFISARSTALAVAAGSELDSLLGRAAS